MIYEKKQLPELYFIKHRHDDNNQFVDYEKHDDNFYNYLFVPSEHFEEIFSSINL